MSKYDIYLYENSKVLKNLLDITTEAALDLAESEYANAGMMLLYNSGFSDFSANGVCTIHKKLFGHVYEWAGQYRIINIQKREEILAGQSVWYSNCWDDIERNMNAIWKKIHSTKNTIPRITNLNRTSILKIPQSRKYNYWNKESIAAIGSFLLEQKY